MGNQIHQAVYGYKEGHRLLASSLTLPRDVEQSMAVLSDLSGPSASSSLESYLTGFPVDELQMYGLARTWYAQELPRPGCVWTHILLAPFSMLASMDNAAEMEHLFRRPRAGSQLTDYRQPLPFHAVPQPAEAVVATSLLGVAAFAALYEHPEQAIIVAADDNRALDRDVLRIWSAQWPELRRRFTFSTGSLAARTFRGEAFQLQIVPGRLLHSVQRGVSSAVVADDSYKPSKCSQWLAREWLLNHNAERWRRFRDVAEEFPPLRRWYRLVATLSARETPTLAIQSLVETDSQELLVDFAEHLLQSHVDKIAGENAGALLKQIFTLATLDAPDEGRLRAAAKELARSNPERAVAVIVQHAHEHVNGMGESAMRGIAEELARDDAAVAEAQSKGLLPLLVPFNPSICQSPAAWQGQDSQLLDMLDAVIQAGMTQEDQRAVVLALLEARKDCLADAVTRRFGTLAVMTVLDWASKQEEEPAIGHAWKVAVSRHAKAFCDWLTIAGADVGVAALRLLLDCLDPRDVVLERTSEATWVALWESARARTTGTLADNLAAFLLAAGLKRIDRRVEGAALVAETFGRVHEALVESRLSYAAWSWMSEDLPHIGWLRDWDKAERLRRGILTRFSSLDVPPDRLVRLIGDTAHWEYVIRTCGNIAGGDRLLNKLADAVKRGDVETVNPSRINAVRQAISGRCSRP